ncbi:hypothetical protein BTH41_01976 [Bacillus mycoides]|nr:hypothetical protein BTH41_01976 [Bacillus mycoides]
MVPYVYTSIFSISLYEEIYSKAKVIDVQAVIFNHPCKKSFST